MNKASVICCLFCLNAAAYNPGPQNNEFAHDPITPGYGISNYFELMPEKVKSINSILQNRLPSKKESFSLKLIRNTLYLAFNKNAGQEQPKLSIFTLSGKLVYRCTIEQSGSQNATYLLPLPQLSKGVYFVHLKNQNAQGQMKVVFTGK